MFGGIVDVILCILAWLYILTGQPIPPRAAKAKARFTKGGRTEGQQAEAGDLQDPLG